MNYCYYHKVDLDGKSSSAIVKKYFSDNGMDLELVPFNYNLEVDFEKIKTTDRVIFVDVVPQPHDILLKLYDIIGDGLYIIDHHASTKESVVIEKLQREIPDTIIIDTRYAGCELTWKYYYPNVQMPKAIHLLGQYDSWRDTEKKKHEGDYEWESTVMPFQFGMRQKEFDVGDFIKDYLCEDFFSSCKIDNVISEGFTILQYQDSQNSVAMKSAFETTVKGHNCLCLNAGLRNSRVFRDKWNPAIHDFMVAFTMQKNMKWSWSFYTDRTDRDASKLAAEFGGGGHKGAAGCYTDDLIFDRRK